MNNKKLFEHTDYVINFPPISRGYIRFIYISIIVLDNTIKQSSYKLFQFYKKSIHGADIILLKEVS